MKRIAIMGAGSWGTALGTVAARAGHVVKLWARNPELVDSINHDHVNPFYLIDTPLPASVWASTDIATVMDGTDLVIIAAPSHATRGLLTDMVPSLQSDMIVVSATKGIEVETGKRISQVVDE